MDVLFWLTLFFYYYFLVFLLSLFRLVWLPQCSHSIPWLSSPCNCFAQRALVHAHTHTQQAIIVSVYVCIYIMHVHLCPGSECVPPASTSSPLPRRTHMHTWGIHFAVQMYNRNISVVFVWLSRSVQLLEMDIRRAFVEMQSSTQLTSFGASRF